MPCQLLDLGHRVGFRLGGLLKSGLLLRRGTAQRRTAADLGPRTSAPGGGAPHLPCRRPPRSWRPSGRCRPVVVASSVGTPSRCYAVAPVGGWFSLAQSTASWTSSRGTRRMSTSRPLAPTIGSVSFVAHTSSHTRIAADEFGSSSRQRRAGPPRDESTALRGEGFEGLEDIGADVLELDPGHVPVGVLEDEREVNDADRARLHELFERRGDFP